MTHRFHDRGGFRIAAMLGLLLTFSFIGGCHPAQLRMPDLRLAPSLSLGLPAIRSAVGGKPADWLQVLSVAFRPGHEQVAAGYSDGRVRLWDIAGRSVIQEFVYGHEVRAIAFSPDGRKLAAAGGSYSDDPEKPGPVRIWDIASGTFELELRGRRGPADALAWSGGARPLIAASFYYGEQRIYVWDAASGERVEQISAGGHGDPSVSFTDDGHYLCVGGAARIYEVPQSKASHFTEFPMGRTGSVAAFPSINRCYGVIPSQMEQLWPLCVVNGCGKPSELWSGPLTTDGSKSKSWGLPAQLDGNPRIATRESTNFLAISEPTGGGAILIWNAKTDFLAAGLIAEPQSKLGDASFDANATRVVALDRVQAVIYLWDLAVIRQPDDAASTHRLK